MKMIVNKLISIIICAVFFCNTLILDSLAETKNILSTGKGQKNIKIGVPVSKNTLERNKKNNTTIVDIKNDIEQFKRGDQEDTIRETIPESIRNKIKKNEVSTKEQRDVIRVINLIAETLYGSDRISGDGGIIERLNNARLNAEDIGNLPEEFNLFDDNTIKEILDLYNTAKENPQTLDNPTIKILDMDNNNTIDDNDPLILLGYIDKIEDEIQDIGRIIDMVREHLFDNIDDATLAEYEELLSHGAIGDFYFDYITGDNDRFNIWNPEFMELLGCVFIWIAKNQNDSSTPFNFGDGIEAILVESEDGNTYNLTLSDGDITIMITYVRPRGIGQGSITEVQAAFDRLIDEQRAQRLRLDRIARMLKNKRTGQKKSKDTLFRLLDQDTEETDTDNMAPVESNTDGGTGDKQAVLNGAQDNEISIIKKDNAGETAATDAHARIRSDNNMTLENVSGAEMLMRNGWHTVMDALYKVFDNVSKETAGAVYTEGKGAIILLESFKTDSGDNDDDNGEDNGDSDA